MLTTRQIAALNNLPKYIPAMAKAVTGGDALHLGDDLAFLQKGSTSSAVARFASTAQRALTGLTAVDGVTIVEGDIGLMKDQTDAKENGLYIASAGAWTRVKDAEGADVVATVGISVRVAEGTTNADTSWIQTNNAPIAVGTDNLTWVQGVTSGASLVDLASTAHSKGASLIGIEDAAAIITATNVETALNELAAGRTKIADLASTANAKGAALVGIEDSAALITATTVETALNELVKYVPVPLTDVGTGQVIPVTRSASMAITQNGAETNTLAIPTFRGQTMEFWVDTDTSGARVITSAQRIDQAAHTVMTLSDVGDFIKLRAITIAGALRWQVVANDGVVLS